MPRRRGVMLAFGLMAIIVCLQSFAAPGDGTWLSKVPPKEKSKKNPYAKDPQAAKAGEKLFQQHCAACHGEGAEGTGSRPSLLSARVQQATPGELRWLLTNGSLKNGMPSWARLPEAQRWQLVTYLKTLEASQNK